MVHVTLVGVKQAKVGGLFIFKGPLLECRECKYKQVCFNLEEGKWYKVTALRPAWHECEVHEGGVRAVEVETIPFEAGVKSRMTVEGSTVTLEEKGCDNIGCVHFRLCHPPGKKAGNKYKIIKLKGTLECPDGEKISLVLLED
jgi:uncharacterized protein (UPF0179 family)